MAITLDGTAGITTPNLTDSSLTASRVVYAGTGGDLTGSANLTFDGTTLSSSISSAASGMSLDSSTAGKANTVYRSAGTQKAIVGLAGAILGTSSTDLGLFAETGGAVKLFANGASTNSGTFNQYGFGIGAAVPSSGQGITFPAAQDPSSNANTLDDYEEGTWTPSLGGTATYATQLGNYIKVGNLVTITFRIGVTLIGTGSATTISGLPFNVTSAIGGGSLAGSVGYWASAATSISSCQLSLASTSTLNLNFTTGNQASSTYGGTFFGNGTVMWATATYVTT